ncbi:NB-ARC domain-containing protein [Streptomyces sp. NPDC005931]|uniref:NB-ARC domain-containing protein n=1 Tax=Streptomyces sp. NPDC005931 TaxID=3364737 RepID=UPI0036C941E1
MTSDNATDFVRQLRELRLSVGQPSMRRLQQLGGQTRAANGDEVDALPRSTVSTVLRGNKLPRSEFVSAFVTACLMYGGQPPEKVAEATERWLAQWRVLYAAEAGEGAEEEDSPGGPAAEAPRSGIVPRHLPLDVRFLAGRGRALKAADELVRRHNSSVFLVSGPVGVGKSAFAIRWAHRMAGDFPDGQLYVDLRSAHGPLDTEHALGVLLGGLGVPEDDCPADPWRRVELYRSLIAHRRMLVVLDNASDTDQVRPLLATGEHCRTVVTSRNRMSGLVAREAARRLTLEVLSPEAACAVLSAVIDAKHLVNARADLEELARLCGYLPLVLRLAAVRFADRPGQGFAHFVRSMRDDSQLLALALDGDRGGIRAELEFSYRRLGLEAKRYFREIGLVDDAGFTLERGAALAGIPLAEADRLTRVLESEHLVAEVGRRRFTMHRILQVFARTKAKEHAAACEPRTLAAA